MFCQFTFLPCFYCFRPEIQKLASVLFYTAIELLRQLLLLLYILEGFFLIEKFFMFALSI